MRQQHERNVRERIYAALRHNSRRVLITERSLTNVVKTVKRVEKAVILSEVREKSALELLRIPFICRYE